MSDPRPSILLVEDEENLRIALADNLEDEGYRVVALDRGGPAAQHVRDGGFDLVLLDIMLPDTDGYAVCRQLRSEGFGGGVLMLTARTLEDDIVRGFEAGADDYLAKPYRLRELLMRVQALLRRAGVTAARPATLGRIQIDRGARSVELEGGEAVELTRTEFDLLMYFLDNAGLALARAAILDAVWGTEVNVDPRTVDNFVSNLKRKLKCQTGCGFAFRAVRGVGYRLELDEG